MPEKNSSLLTGYGIALGATALWSGNFIVARGLTAMNMSLIAVTFPVFVCAVLILSGIVLANQTSQVVKK